MGLGLDAGTEDGEDLAVGPRECVGRRCGGAGGADHGDRLGVGDAVHRASLSVIGDYYPLVAGAAGALGIGEDADQLGPEGRKRGELARHGAEHLVVADGEDLAERLRAFAARQRDHRAAHGVDAAGVIKQPLDLGRVIEADWHGAALAFPLVRREG